MCGIGGMFSGGPLPPDHGPLLEAMAETLVHRGPDGTGVWSDPAAGVGLCHARLAVLDLSRLGAQPMTDAEGRGWIVYNGEVYNYRELRRELTDLGCRFVSTTDTEVVLAACLTWGVEAALKRFVGMFAFALWIPGQRALYLVRDRLGIKPLYYGRTGGALLFGSELKTLCAHPRFPRRIDPRARELFHMLQYVPSPRTIYRDASKLPPGHFLLLTGGHEKLVRWWDPDEGALEAEGVEGGRPLSELSSLLDDAVRGRLVSDVPLGAFLSGGMDSGLVVAAMSRTGGERPLTFTVSYSEDDYDEGPHAREVARHLGTRHHAVRVDGRTLLDGIPDLPLVFDEPLSDPSALPMMVLSRFAREHVTVILSGDGGDELFGGYDRYRFLERYFRTFGERSPSLRSAAGTLLGLLPSRGVTGAYSLARRITGKGPVENFAGKWEKLLKLLNQEGPAGAYQSSIGVFSAAETGRLLGREGVPPLPEPFVHLLDGPSDLPFLRRMMDLDTRTFLADDVLAKVDRASMAVGLEVRVPLLDHRVVAWSRRAPTELLFEEGRGKAPLRKLARRDLPRRIAGRPKMGFTMPLDSWLRGELRDLLHRYLGGGSGSLTGAYDAAYVRDLIRDHLSGRRNNHERLWNLLVYAMWEEKWRPAAG